MSSRNDRGRRNRSPSPSTSSDEETFTHIQCWIPASGIDLVVLATYLKEFIDDTATIKPSPNPQNASKQGYTIGARNTLSVYGCRDIIDDSRQWEKEKTTRDYRKEPYSFNESDTWHNRRKKGASPGHTNPRRRRKPAGETADPAPRPTTVGQTTRPGNRHGRDPSPEPPPRPSHPPPDLLKNVTRIPQPDALTDPMRKLSIAELEKQREQYRKTTAMSGLTATDTSANRGARMQQPSTAASRHKEDGDDESRTTTGFTSGGTKRGRHGDEDDALSTTSTLIGSNPGIGRKGRHNERER